MDALTLPDGESDRLSLALGLRDQLADADGLILPEGEIDFDSLADGDNEPDGEID